MCISLNPDNPTWLFTWGLLHFMEQQGVARGLGRNRLLWHPQFSDSETERFSILEIIIFFHVFWSPFLVLWCWLVTVFTFTCVLEEVRWGASGSGLIKLQPDWATRSSLSRAPVFVLSHYILKRPVWFQDASQVYPPSGRRSTYLLLTGDMNSKPKCAKPLHRAM